MRIITLAVAGLLAGSVEAAPVWIEDVGFRWVDETGAIATDECWDGKRGAPIDCALLQPGDMPKAARRYTSPMPRPPCLTPRTPGCPAVTVFPATTFVPPRPVVAVAPPSPSPRAPVFGSTWFGGSSTSITNVTNIIRKGCDCPDMPAPPPPYVIPLPAGGWLLLSALATAGLVLRRRR